jgi:hypothetical protein
VSNPFLNRVARKGKSGHGKKSEQRVAKSLKALLTPASGALRGAKGDMVLHEFRMEAKSTIGHSVAIQLAWLVKIQHEANSSGSQPGVIISFVTPEGKGRVQDWVLIPKSTFEELRER